MLIPRLTTEIPLARLLHLWGYGTPAYRITMPCDIMMHAPATELNSLLWVYFYSQENGEFSPAETQASRVLRDRGIRDRD